MIPSRPLSARVSDLNTFNPVCDRTPATQTDVDLLQEHVENITFADVTEDGARASVCTLDARLCFHNLCNWPFSLS